MSWTSAIKKAQASFAAPKIVPLAPILPEAVDWGRLVSLDFETYYDSEYTLSKLSTSEYIRDPRFKAQMVGIKIGLGKTRVIPAARIKAELRKINWATHSLLCHNTQFDGLILSHHYNIIPARYYCTMSMARGLHSNEIGAGLDEVSVYYGGQGKIEGALEQTKGVLNWSKTLYDNTAIYCANDVDEMFRIFREMVPVFPSVEMQLIHMTVRMFCAPVLRVNIPRVEAEYKREVEHRERLMMDVIDQSVYYEDKAILKTKTERALTGKERDMLVTKRVIGSNERFAELLRGAGVEPPLKISPAWMKKSRDERNDDDKWVYAFAKDDLEFITLPDHGWEYWEDLNPNDPSDVLRLAARQEVIRQLVEVRLAVKSTTNITRAERFRKAGANGWKLPVGYAYARAHTLRWGGNNKMNMQNLTRGGELRLSIEAEKGHQMAVVDSGQIEARVNGWLWDQNDLLDAFRVADTWDKSKGVARGNNRDAYCRFGDLVYGREITTDDKLERFVGKVCVAEGELVLTDRGLTPIERISKEDRLWDGVEWVSHGGLIDQGIREVITYDGLTATPDHQVFVEDGRIISLGQAASELARLQVTGDQGRGIRFCDSAVVADTSRKRLSVRQGQMRPDWYYEADIAEQLKAQEDDLVLEERTPPDTTRSGAGASVRRDSSAVHQLETQRVGELRRARDSSEVQQPDGVHPVGFGESSTPGLQGGGDRQGRQRRTLRAGQFAVGYTNGAEPEQTQHSKGDVAGGVGATGRVQQSVLPHSHMADGVQRIDGRADIGTGALICDEQAQELALNRRETRVYDIADAGPRRRFTVQSRIILNCVLGLGFQMGAAKFQMTLAKGALGGPKVVFPLEQCHQIVQTYRRKNYRIAAGWETCKEWIEHMADPNARPIHYKCLEIGYGYILLPNGLTLKYPDLKKAMSDKGWEEWSYQSGDIRKKIYGGLLCLAGDTEVLTDSGWKALAGVGRTDRVWDGVQWVSHDGVAYQGTKNVIDFGGVWMTPDHRVFSGGSWHEAQYTTYTQATSSFTRHFRAPPWFTDGGGSTWQRRTPDAMESSVRLRSDSNHLGDGVHEGQDKVVRVSHKADAQRADEDARHVQASSLCRLAQHVSTLPQPHPCGVPALRGARDQHLQPMVDVCAVLGGHGGDVPAWPDSGAQGQQQELLARKLCVGDLQGAVQQQAHLYTIPDASRGADDLGSDGRQWTQPQHSVLPAEEQMAHGETAIPVYDIVNAGPNRRFTVRGADGRPFVVHNCENLVQALARIIVAEQMVMIDKKYPVVMTTHDECVTHPKKAQAQKCFDYMMKCMTTAPAWCPDIPLAAEGGFADNYSK